MVKPKQPVSPQSDETLHTGHPLTAAAAQVDRFMRQSKEREAQQEFKIDELKEWNICVNAVAASEAGRMLLKNMVKFSGMHEPGSYKDTMRMVDVRLKSEFYLKWIRPFLNPDLRSAVE